MGVKSHHDPGKIQVDLGESLIPAKPKTLLNVKDAELIELGGGHPSLICRTSKLPEGWIPITFLSLGLVVCLCLGYYVYFNFHEFHFHLSRAYASLGHAHAQHLVGERMLHGAGTAKDEVQAMKYFRLAADQGHPHAAYNLAIGHLQGIESDVMPGEAHHLIRHAHDNGVEEAEDVLHNACGNGMCGE